MNDLLAEQPWIVSMMLALVGGALVYGWLQTGKKPAAVMGGIAFALIPVAFMVASNWETDREQIEALIYETADAVERNDFERAYQIIGDEKAEAMARQELPQFEFTMAKVNKLRSIVMIEGASPKEADADLSVKVDVSTKRGGVKNIRVVRALQLRFRKEGDRWRVVEYRHSPIAGGPDQFSTP
ncbi:hypothetical protein [Rubripirellula reticaptiva]|uniref:Uncharacterized protein n=1 Tax=Rubripirellula reticaptiva TaxID=2528013 RepID=A0A5C6EJZ0_9BACT|nr:hypothetical protein [Rubripirellula reticaptiva]TWU47936.1 hypothetical protein Poly59_47800 [Rubripirellula reticaptiva]